MNICLLEKLQHERGPDHALGLLAKPLGEYDRALPDLLVEIIRGIGVRLLYLPGEALVNGPDAAACDNLPALDCLPNSKEYNSFLPRPRGLSCEIHKLLPGLFLGLFREEVEEAFREGSKRLDRGVVALEGRVFPAELLRALDKILDQVPGVDFVHKPLQGDGCNGELIDQTVGKLFLFGGQFPEKFSDFPLFYLRFSAVERLS